MATEITVTSIVKYETIVTTYDSFTARRIRVTDCYGFVTEFAMYHTTGDPFEHVPLVRVDRRETTKGAFSEDE
jgi:hypothetical protein